jgi:zinc/manganese transport system permease protein
MADGLQALLLEPLHFRFMCRGFAVAVMLGITGGLAGSILLLRRMALMADSFGHALLPGVGVAYLLVGPGLGSLFIGAATAGLITALIGSVVSRLSRLKEDAAFGSLFIICFALGAALMSRLAAPVDLLHYLFGNILAVTSADLVLVTIAASLSVMAVLVFYRVIVLETFDPTFHRACGGRGLLVLVLTFGLITLDLVAALQAVGTILALGFFILPAATAYLWCDRLGWMLLWAAIIGGTGSVLGLYGSYVLDQASGPCMVAGLGLYFVLSLLLAPHGIVRRRRRGGPAIAGQDEPT